MGVVSKPAASDFCLKAELHGIPQALLLLLVLPTACTVWTFPMSPMTLPSGAFASMMRNSEKSLPTFKELIEHLVSLNNNIFLSFNVSQPLGKNYIYSLYSLYTLSKICGMWHLQISFHQQIMRWTSGSNLTNGFLDPWSQPGLHLYKKPITPGWLVWLCFWNWKALANTPKNSKETTHATCIAHHPIHP